MELYNIVWGDYILNKKPLTLEKAEQELQGLKFYEPEIKKAKNQLKESNMGGFGNDLLSVIKEIESMIMNKKLGNIENHKKAQAELKILKDAYNIMWKYEPIMRLTELKQVIRKEISAVLNEANDPSDNAVTSVEGNIMTTRKGKKYKVLTTRPKAGSADFYYDTIMKRIEQLDPEDWDVDVNTYKKAMPL